MMVSAAPHSPLPFDLDFGPDDNDELKLTRRASLYATCSPSPIFLPVPLLAPPSFPLDPFSIRISAQSRPSSPVALPFHSVFKLDDDDDDDDVDESIDTVNLPAAKSPKAAPGRPPAKNENPQRPPARPHLAVRSNLDQETNPFDLSFSINSHHSNSSESDRNTPPRGTDATSIKHNALPPLSSLTSPAAADPSQFPWLASQSLRTGPLSPAMLAGPQAQNGGANAASHGPRPPQPAEGNAQEGGFDTTTFRTGFTPGAGSGFTPGYSSLMAGNFASSLPMPSPNTAAFLNMVTNSTPLGEGAPEANAHNQSGQSGQPGVEGQPPHPPSAIPPHLQAHHGLSHLQPGPHAPHGDAAQDTITPGTLSALTGVFNDMSRQPVNGAPHPPQYFQPGLQHHSSSGPIPHGVHPPHLPHGVDYAQQSANAASQAANGLFLLSQAHQELSKREEEGRPGVPPAAPGVGTPLMNKKGGGQGTMPPRPPVQQHSTQGTKRKSEAGTAKGGKKGKKNGANNASPMNMGKIQSASPEFDMESEDDEDIIKRGGKPETEEEKRKNFLERNRQGV